MMMYTRSARAGFSFPEMIIALLIMAVMIAGALSLFSWVRKAQRTSSEQTLRSIQFSINNYHTETGVYPATLIDLIRRPSDTTIAKRWKGPYTDEQEGTIAAKDGWKNELQYHLNPKGSARPYELFSWGPNGDSSSDQEHISVWDL